MMEAVSQGLCVGEYMQRQEQTVPLVPWLVLRFPSPLCG